MRRPWEFVVVGVLLALPLCAARIWFADFGAYPTNDDPLYGRMSQIWVDEGRFQNVTVRGALAASVVSHAAWGAIVCKPFGFSYSRLHLSMAIMGWAGAMAIYAIARNRDCGVGSALAVASTLVLTPMYFGLTFTFMTDISATAFFAIAVACYAEGLSRDSLAWLVFGSVATVLAVWARQTHLCAFVFPVTVIVGQAWERKAWSGQWKRLVAAAGIPIVGWLAFEFSWIVPGDADRLEIVLVHRYDLDRLHEVAIEGYGLCLLIGMILLPIAPLLAARLPAARRGMPRAWKLFADTAGGLVGALLLCAFAVTGALTYITGTTGVFLQNSHFGPILLSDMDEPGRWGDMGGVEWPALFWQTLSVVAMVSAAHLTWWAVFTVACWSARPRGDNESSRRAWIDMGLLATMAAGGGGMFVVIHNINDRYWMILFPALFAWVASLLGDSRLSASRAPTWSVAVSTMLLAASVTVSFIWTHDFLAWNQTRWRRVEQWLAEGLEPFDFDGGSDVNFWFRSAEDPDTPLRPGDDSVNHSGLADLALAIGPRPGWREVERLPWRAWATGREHFILVLAKENPEPVAR